MGITFYSECTIDGIETDRKHEHGTIGTVLNNSS
jgi:hypothetical protein